MVQELQDIIRYQVNKFIFKNGYAPKTNELAQTMNVEEDEIKKGLKQLQDNHAIVLHPDSFDIWVVHPFALFPTMFWVESEKQSWYGNCTWCSLGIAALVNENVKIHTKLNGTNMPLTINIVNDIVCESELVVHFPIPAKKFWDNVIYTCSNMLTFQSEREVVNWCDSQRMIKGEIKPITKVWELAKLWYGNYLSPEWTRKTPEQAEDIFQSVGFTSDFWKLK